jgi:nicotinate-nucleotide adenylyltransferase
MGEDNLESLPKWKNYEQLIAQHELIVYPRVFAEKKNGDQYLQDVNIHLVKAPIVELSATEIRDMIKAGKNVRPMLPPEVFEYLEGSNFYK